MVPLKRKDVSPALRAPRVSVPEAAFLNKLRFVAMACRAKRRTGLFEACALLHADRNASRDAHADALMRCLDQALGQQAILHSPGTDELSFDERWLLALARAITVDDADSAAFLLRRRVGAEHRRLVTFLIARICICFDKF